LPIKRGGGEMVEKKDHKKIIGVLWESKPLAKRLPQQKKQPERGTFQNMPLDTLKREKHDREDHPKKVSAKENWNKRTSLDSFKTWERHRR